MSELRSILSRTATSPLHLISGPLRFNSPVLSSPTAKDLLLARSLALNYYGTTCEVAGSILISWVSPLARSIFCRIGAALLMFPIQM
jgi:hypothetical protein